MKQQMITIAYCEFLWGDDALDDDALLCVLSKYDALGAFAPDVYDDSMSYNELPPDDKRGRALNRAFVYVCDDNALDALALELQSSGISTTIVFKGQLCRDIAP